MRVADIVSVWSFSQAFGLIDRSRSGADRRLPERSQVRRRIYAGCDSRVGVYLSRNVPCTLADLREPRSHQSIGVDGSASLVGATYLG